MFKSITILSGCLALASAPIFAQGDSRYAEPEISTIMIRLDKLPIDTFDIQRISLLLNTLAKAETNGDRAQLRNRAQLIALAMRLDSSNKLSSEINRRYKSGATGGNLSHQDRNKAIKRLDSVISYLSKAEIGSEAHVLANYLKDALKGLDSNNPHVANHSVNKDRWKNVIPESRKADIMPEPEIKPDPKMVDGDDTGPEPLDAPDSEVTGNSEAESKPDPKPAPQPIPDDSRIVFKWGDLETKATGPVYFHKKENDKDVHWLELANIFIKVSPKSKGQNELEVHFDSGVEGSEDRKRIRDFLKKFLNRQGQDFPSAKLTIKLPNEFSKRNGSNPYFPIILQIQASITGKKMLPNVIALGVVTDSGHVKADHRFWNNLRQVRKSKALQQVLVFPKSAKQDFLQLVALEESDFFIRNEVIAVSDVKDAIKYTTETDYANIRKAHEMFLGLQKSIGTRSVGQFATNSKVKKILAEVLELNPNHVSAEMILLRGDIKRAKHIEDKYVAIEIGEMINEAKKTYESNADSLDSNYLSAKSALIKEKLTLIEDYIDSEHDELITELEIVIAELYNMSRARRKHDSDFHKRSAENAHKRLKSAYKSIKSMIDDLE